MKKSTRILYVGALWAGGTCLQRMEALKDLGYYVLGIDTHPEHVRFVEKRLPYRIRLRLYRAGWERLGAKDLAGVNARILNLVNENKNWEILWIDKGLTIEPQTIDEVKFKIPDCTIVGYSPDDMSARHNQSRQFLQHLNKYDVYFTTKSYGVSELKLLGARKVEFIANGFDLKTHRPVTVTSVQKQLFGGAVGFIGDFEKERAESLSFLGDNDIHVRVWGSNWHKCRKNLKNVSLERKCLWGENYSLGLCAFDINLCFLRKINRDLQTQRSVEIPACGGFMLAERTQEHIQLFAEGREAEYFGSNLELVDKTKYYLKNSEERKKIASAGRKRCIKSGYSNHHRMGEMLNIIRTLR